jgi:hypothetical protein
VNAFVRSGNEIYEDPLGDKAPIEFKLILLEETSLIFFSPLG